MIKLIIDRFEGTYAICEMDDKSMVKIPKYRLPLDCKEGDCLIQDSNEMIQKDNEATDRRNKHLKEKLNRLFK
ncbi:MAG TPA: DUF3006 domain-containing protein [Lachnospiraceae bacterium]|jgi:hypothetical protein|nr:DUF3006 domain-containing protein [Lachnospiraceae bacterium]